MVRIGVLLLFGQRSDDVGQLSESQLVDLGLVARHDDIAWSPDDGTGVKRTRTGTAGTDRQAQELRVARACYGKTMPTLACTLPCVRGFQ